MTLKISNGNKGNTDLISLSKVSFSLDFVIAKGILKTWNKTMSAQEEQPVEEKIEVRRSRFSTF